MGAVDLLAGFQFHLTDLQICPTRMILFNGKLALMFIKLLFGSEYIHCIPCFIYIAAVISYLCRTRINSVNQLFSSRWMNYLLTGLLYWVIVNINFQIWCGFQQFIYLTIWGLCHEPEDVWRTNERSWWNALAVHKIPHKTPMIFNMKPENLSLLVSIIFATLALAFAISLDNLATFAKMSAPYASHTLIKLTPMLAYIREKFNRWRSHFLERTQEPEQTISDNISPDSFLGTRDQIQQEISTTSEPAEDEARSGTREPSYDPVFFAGEPLASTSTSPGRRELELRKPTVKGRKRSTQYEDMPRRVTRQSSSMSSIDSA
ncbi:uncharacterized protein [Periplaneta americana]|uniref:uncharacterized protein n=1 Tax=Periplaneta americana TaxID=6978 RepID=UPI0037E75A7C